MCINTKRLMILLCVSMSMFISLSWAYSQSNEQFVTGIDWNSEGTKVAIVYAPGEVIVVNLETQAIVFATSAIRTVASIEWNPIHSDYLAIGGNNENSQGSVAIVDTLSDNVIHVLDGGQSVGSIAWKPDGNEIAAASNVIGPPRTSRNEIRVWNSSTGDLVTQAMYSLEPITSIAWSPDGTRIVGATTSSVLFVWDVTTGETIRELNGHSDVVLSVAWSPDGSRIASTGSTLDNTLRIWDATTGSNIATYPSRFGTVLWSPDSTQLAVGESLSLRVLDANTGREIFNAAANELTLAISYSPYGARLAYSSITPGSDIQQIPPSLLDSLIKIVVPDPTLERLQSIAALCDAPLTVTDAIPQVEQTAALTDFVAQVTALPEGTIPPACAADLIAVAGAMAEAINAGQ